MRAVRFHEYGDPQVLTLEEATYPADRAADAHAHVQGGNTRGKVVLTF